MLLPSSAFILKVLEFYYFLFCYFFFSSFSSLPTPLVQISCVEGYLVRLSPVGNKDPLICSRAVPLKCHSLRQFLPPSLPLSAPKLCCEWREGGVML